MENLADRDGLLKYIARKIGVGNVCVWCNEMGKAFYSLTAVRQHMIGLYFYLVAITATCIYLCRIRNINMNFKNKDIVN